MGEPITPEQSRKAVRYYAGVFFLVTLVVIIDTFGVYDLPGEWNIPWEMCCGILIGINFGHAWCNGWPERALVDLQQSPSILHEEE
jgi:hypothetical protein